MARIRSVKPEFWKSEAIARLPFRTRLTFIALWSYVDDNGVGRDIPQLIAGELFALEPDPRETLANVQRDLARLSEEGRITRYTVADKRFLHITNWTEHQRIDKPNRARYPGPDDPGAALTCGYGDSREDVAEPSRDPREVLAHVQRPEKGSSGAGSREQGAADNPSCPPLRDERDSDRGPTPFDEFWSAYPRKVAKIDARKAYSKARKTATHETIVAGAVRFASDRTRDQEFTPYPASWLNDGRWEDEGPVRPTSNVRAITGRIAEGDEILREAFNRGQAQRLGQQELGA